MKSLKEVYERWPTEEDCIEYLEKVRWPERPLCPYCQSEKVSFHREKSRKRRWQCDPCSKSFSVTVGTIFHHTHIDLRKWLLLIFLGRRGENWRWWDSSEVYAAALKIRRPTAGSMKKRLEENKWQSKKDDLIESLKLSMAKGQEESRARKP